MLDDPINAVRHRRKAEIPYDGVAELRRGSREASEKAFTTPDGRAAAAVLIEDERKGIDLDRSALRIANERPLIG